MAEQLKCPIANLRPPGLIARDGSYNCAGCELRRGGGRARVDLGIMEVVECKPQMPAGASTSENSHQTR